MPLSPRMKNDRCLICFKKIVFSPRIIFERNICICSDCLQEMNPVWKKIKINNRSGYAIYPYEEKIKSLLYQYKGCCDIALAPIFLSPFCWIFFFLSKNHIFVPVPSFFEHDLKRGFNHVEEMLNSLHIPFIRCIRKIKEVKQSVLSFNERIKAKENFALINESIKYITNKKVILIDDVVTTTSTLSACVMLLETAEIRDISFISMSYVCRD